MITHHMLQKIAAAGEAELSESVTALLVKIQQYDVDPLGWGLHYGARHWNNDTEMGVWDSLFPRLKFQVSADVDIKYSGMIK
jgi:hypothetical protein